MHMVFAKLLKARAVFERSIKEIGWQTGAPKSRVHDFPGTRPLFF